MYTKSIQLPPTTTTRNQNYKTKGTKPPHPHQGPNQSRKLKDLDEHHLNTSLLLTKDKKQINFLAFR